MTSPDLHVERYLDRLAHADHDPILLEMEDYAQQSNFPAIGAQVGQLLYVLATTMGARRVLEIGSGFGYSAYWFCKAVGPEGEVILTEKDAPDAERARDYLTRAGFIDRVAIHIGEADETLLELPGTFDIIFLDARKTEYPYYQDRAMKRLRLGGLLIADNVLWRGKVAEEAAADDADTQALQQFNTRLFESPKLRSTIIPLRDGVSISVKVR